ncbi:MAG: T9SS type A sorting domain-containing protein [Cytophagales bacterium]|nr:T9SS type A sorting domain-containing protein [Cytophagales bacterium]
MKHIKIISLLFLIGFFENSKAQTYSQPAEVISAGGGESSGGIYSNFGVIGETFVESSVSGGNYNTSIGFLYASDIPPTGIDEEYFNNPIIRIFPNPSDEIVHIENKNTEADKIEIHNILGEKVYESKYKSMLNISELSKGIYFLEILDKDGVILKNVKIIKE